MINKIIMHLMTSFCVSMNFHAFWCCFQNIRNFDFSRFFFVCAGVRTIWFSSWRIMMTGIGMMLTSMAKRKNGLTLTISKTRKLLVRRKTRILPQGSRQKAMTTQHLPVNPPKLLRRHRPLGLRGPTPARLLLQLQCLLAANVQGARMPESEWRRQF